jgi:hypothetical protein
MSLLNEEEVFQQADKQILEWKQYLRQKFNDAYYRQKNIRIYMGYPEVGSYDYGKFFDWVEEKGKWIELEKAIKKYADNKYDDLFGLYYTDWAGLGKPVDRCQDTDNWFGQKTVQKLDTYMYDYAFD